MTKSRFGRNLAVLWSELDREINAAFPIQLSDEMDPPSTGESVEESTPKDDDFFMKLVEMAMMRRADKAAALRNEIQALSDHLGAKLR